jgi:hypothetical protein
MTKKAKSKSNWKFNSYRYEWICEHGVGHYDPDLLENTVHGCDGCCSKPDFPPTLRKTKQE